jgi:hypothetical protein
MDPLRCHYRWVIRGSVAGRVCEGWRHRAREGHSRYLTLRMRMPVWMFVFVLRMVLRVVDDMDDMLSRVLHTGAWNSRRYRARRKISSSNPRIWQEEIYVHSMSMAFTQYEFELTNIDHILEPLGPREDNKGSLVLYTHSCMDPDGRAGLNMNGCKYITLTNAQIIFMMCVM